jgi:pimeloyl-ACP methyl ester carboxylesterase
MTTPTTLGPWKLVFDAQGDVDGAGEQQLVEQLQATNVTDLVMFCHGWNNDEAAATALYGQWFDLLNAQIGASRKVGFVGLRWPSQLWRDVPIPDFDPTPGGAAPGAAALDETATADAEGPALSPQQLQDLKTLFPRGSAELDEIASLLAANPDQDRADELFATMKKFNDAVSVESTDGEAPESKRPGMLEEGKTANEVFGAYANALIASGVDITGGGGGGGAGLSDQLDKLWHGAKEALRGLSYWQMKNRAGVVGQRGVGPLIGRIATAFPTLRIHLVGHSFGARVVSFALAGLPAGDPSPVKSVTLLEGAFSRFAFTDHLPWNPEPPNGALAGQLGRVDGPVTVCFSSHDMALSLSYPLASAASGDDRAGAADPLFRFRAIGSLGAYNSPTRFIDQVGTNYPFTEAAILNIDSSAVVANGDPPAGAHSDIFHEELAWIVAAAAQLTA